MITPDQAEALATKAMEYYVRACGCDNEQDVANVLMKLVSVCGVGMAAVVGRDDAVARLTGSAAYIQETRPEAPWKKETIQ